MSVYDGYDNNYINGTGQQALQGKLSARNDESDLIRSAIRFTRMPSSNDLRGYVLDQRRNAATKAADYDKLLKLIEAHPEVLDAMQIMRRL